MKRGDVVEVDWPFSDRMGSKTRSAVVAQADFLNGIIDDTILVQITGTRHGIPGKEPGYRSDPATEAALEQQRQRTMIIIVEALEGSRARLMGSMWQSGRLGEIAGSAGEL